MSAELKRASALRRERCQDGRERWRERLNLSSGLLARPVSSMGLMGLMGLVSLVSLVSGCTPSEAPPMSPSAPPLGAPSSTLSSPPSSPSSSPQASGEVLARVGERVITEADLKRELAHLPALIRGRYARRERQRELLEAMIRVELLAHLSREAGYEQRPAARLAFERALASQLALSRDERASLDHIKLLTPLPAALEPLVEPSAPTSPLSPLAHPQEEP